VLLFNLHYILANILQVETILKATARTLGQPVNAQGAGLVQACEAVVEAVKYNLSVTGNTVTSNSQISLAGHAGCSQSIS
jgi:hypothetical protein